MGGRKITTSTRSASSTQTLSGGSIDIESSSENSILISRASTRDYAKKATKMIKLITELRAAGQV